MQPLSQRQLLTRGYCAEPSFPAAAGTCQHLMYRRRKPLLPCWTNKRKMFKNKGCVYIPQSAFHCGKRCLGGLGGSEPQWSHVCCHTAPQVSPQALLSTLSAAGGASRFCIANAASQCPAAPGSCWHTVPAGAFLSSEAPGSRRRGWYPSWCNPQMDISTEALQGDCDSPMLLWMWSDSKVHGAHKRRGPRFPPWEGLRGQDQQK